MSENLSLALLIGSITNNPVSVLLIQTNSTFNKHPEQDTLLRLICQRMKGPELPGCDDSTAVRGASYGPPALFESLHSQDLSLRIGDTTIRRDFPLSTFRGPATVSPRRAFRIYTRIEGTREAFSRAIGKIILRPRTLRG